MISHTLPLLLLLLVVCADPPNNRGRFNYNERVIHGYSHHEYFKDSTELNLGWTSSGLGEELINDVGHPLPSKLQLPIEVVVDKCKRRIPFHDNNVPAYIANDMHDARDILLNLVKQMFPFMPDNIEDILLNELPNGECIYVLYISSGTRIGFKAGDSGDCPTRIDRQIGPDVFAAGFNFREHGFVLPSPSTLVSSGLVSQEAIDELWDFKHLASTAGVHVEKKPLWEKQTVCQMAELLVTCSYDFVEGPVGEKIMRAPSEFEWRINDYVAINNQYIKPHESKLQMIFANTYYVDENYHRQSSQLIVDDVDTWTTLASELSKNDKLALFMAEEYKDHLSGYLAKSNVDEEYYGEFSDIISVSPYSTKVEPSIKKLNNVLRTSSFLFVYDFFNSDESVKEGAQEILDGIETNVYQNPNEREHAKLTVDKLKKLDGKSNRRITRMRFSSMKAARTEKYGYLKKYKKYIGKTIEFTGDYIYRDGNGKLAIKENGAIIVSIHLTRKFCNIILERGSHFKSLALESDTITRLNAIYSYNYESILLNRIRKLSTENLFKSQTSSITRTMLITGIDKQGNQSDAWLALKLTVPYGVSDGGQKSGQRHLQAPIKISSEVRDTNKSGRDTLPIDLIYHMIDEVTYINRLFELNDGKICIGTTQVPIRYYLLVSNKSGDPCSLTYYQHYDYVHDDESVTDAINYINEVRGQPTPLLLEVTVNTLYKLYGTIDQQNFAQSERQSLVQYRRDQFLDKFERENDLLSEALNLFSPYGRYTQLEIFLAHVDHMDKLFQDEENRFVDQDQNTWLILAGPRGSQQDKTRKYLLQQFMSKTGREYELMKKHLIMKGYSNMANRDKYNEVMRMKGETSEQGRRFAKRDSMMPDREGSNPNSGRNTKVNKDLANNWPRPGPN